MVGYVVVELWCQCTQSREPGPWDRREIVVLVVVSHIVREDVEGTIVAVCLLLETIPEVMFGNEMASTRVETASEEARHDEVYEGAPAAGLDEDIVKY
jgi:hypothetical protein